MEGISGLAMMKLITHIIEPLVTQSVVDGTVVPEIYLRLSCAVAYHNSGQPEKAIAHVDKAVEKALADRLYGLLTEYIRHFDGLLEERIALRDEDALQSILELNRIYHVGWSRLSGIVRNKYIATNLTPREHEIAKLSAFGFGVKEIAGMLYVSESTIKQTIARVINKSGIQDKSEFSYIL